MGVEARAACLINKIWWLKCRTESKMVLIETTLHVVAGVIVEAVSLGPSRYTRCNRHLQTMHLRITMQDKRDYSSRLQ